MRVPGFHPVPPFRQGRTDLTFDFATVGIYVRPVYESVHRCRIQVLHTRTRARECARVRQFAEIHGALELPVGICLSNVFRALPPIARLLPSLLCPEGAALRISAE
ncbi:hypothetical protein EVAR_63436_1 [Eumeta japonica]|uniref:Uncharacterized protein n=1 Tax=Eumeta variegata TaxID=151549 RepID=A0A4C1YQM5_EUMVA|nr:hypothetical protein EVAR_63436_1 [Eumeta japonica]